MVKTIAKVLVVDDDQVLCEMLTDQLQRLGYEAVSSSKLVEAEEIARSGDFDVVFLDVQMPDGNGLESLPEFKKVRSAPEVIIMTGEGDSDGAEMAIKNGAWDYLEKPNVIKEMLLPLARVIEYLNEKRKAAYNAVSLKRQGIIGSSTQLAKCLDQIAKVSASDVNVLLTGGTGTGKEIFAKVVHENSQRSGADFVVVDCASLPENLVESILFGHEKGAFTGADKSDSGLIKQADGGTLFLDEVGEIDLNIQKKFLRVLQSQRYRSVGGKKEVSSNFRLVAATNKDLRDMVTRGEFREDLFFRLQTAIIDLPPLRERQGDIEELTLHFVNLLCQRDNIETKGYSPDLIKTLNSYPWPGNVRELFNTIEMTLNNALHEPILYSRHLPDNLRIHAARTSLHKKDLPLEHEIQKAADVDVDCVPPEKPASFKDYREAVLADVERDYLQNLMKYCRGSIKEACAVSGLGRTSLYLMMKKHNISRLGWSS